MKLGLRIFAIYFLCLFTVLGSAGAQTPALENPGATMYDTLKNSDAVVVKLKNKELVIGRYLEKTATTVVVESDALGRVEIPLDKVDSVTPMAADIEVKTDVAKTPPKKIWENRIEGGLNGSTGNVNNFSMRAAASSKRTTDSNRLKFGAVYNLDYAKDTTTNQQKKTGNRLNVDARSEWPLKFLPRFNYYVAGNFYYDEFKDYDFQLNGNTGFGYDIINRPTPTLLLFTTHAGAGVSKKFGAQDEKEGELTPEAVFGLNFDWEPFNLQKVSASTEIFPNLRDLGEFRWVNKASWLFYLTKAKNLNFSIGAEDRYDTSHAPEDKANDLDYFANIGWSF